MKGRSGGRLFFKSFSGTPTTAGSYSFTIGVHDNQFPPAKATTDVILKVGM